MNYNIRAILLITLIICTPQSNTFSAMFIKSPLKVVCAYPITCISLSVGALGVAWARKIDNHRIRETRIIHEQLNTINAQYTTQNGQARLLPLYASVLRTRLKIYKLFRTSFILDETNYPIEGSSRANRWFTKKINRYNNQNNLNQQQLFETNFQSARTGLTNFERDTYNLQPKLDRYFVLAIFLSGITACTLRGLKHIANTAR